METISSKPIRNDKYGDRDGEQETEKSKLSNDSLAYTCMTIEQSALNEMKTIATIAASTSTNAAITNRFFFSTIASALDNVLMHFTLLRLGKQFQMKKEKRSVIHTNMQCYRTIKLK